MSALSSHAQRIGRMTLWLVGALLFLLAGPLLALAVGKASLHGDWRTATHRSAGLAPDPATHPGPVVQVYASRAFAWRGAFADHTWVAAKPAGADHYTRYEVIGWRAGDGRSVVSMSNQRAPDAEWFGAPPRLLQDLRGKAAEAVMARLDAVVAAYPYPATYRVWPGPNSNTFVAYLGRAIPELRLVMPSTAIGKDYVSLAQLIGPSPSHTGFAVSLYGLLGITAAWDEGLEINVLGLVTGVDVRHPALKLPGIGRVPGDG